jgi:hypothetical protein
MVMKKIMILSAVVGIIGSGPIAVAQNADGSGATIVGQDFEALKDRQINREPGVTTGSVRPFDTEQQVNRGKKQDRMLLERGNAEDVAPVMRDNSPL